MGQELITAENVGKKFCRSLKKSLWYGLRDIGGEFVGRDFGGQGHLRADEFWAVKDINFSVRRGECLALIGRNGAGKTTLLRMLCGLIRPNRGRIQMRGHVSAMIALGAGMKDVLSGRENAYIMASLRGMSKSEADRKIDEIIEFAEIEDAIDAPMRSYSSGMRVRLNFAVAASLDPDVVLLDEVLAVGDASFRNKCYLRIAELRRKAAVIFVSHNMEQIARTSTQALVIDHGSTNFHGSVDEGIQHYESLNLEQAESHLTAGAFLSVQKPIKSFNAEILSRTVRSGDPLVVRIDLESESPMPLFEVKVLFYNTRGAFAADGCISSENAGVRIEEGMNRIQIDLASVPLKNGIYAVAFNLMDEIGDFVVWSYKNHTVEVRGGYVGGIADCHLRLGLQSRE